jgi:hypothetical protein
MPPVVRAMLRLDAWTFGAQVYRPYKGMPRGLTALLGLAGSIGLLIEEIFAAYGVESI